MDVQALFQSRCLGSASPLPCPALEQSINALNFGEVFGGLRTAPKPQPFVTVSKFTTWAKKLVKSGRNIASGGNPKYAMLRRYGCDGRNIAILCTPGALTSMTDPNLDHTVRLVFNITPGAGFL